jgi:hypothetical protein
MRDIYERLALLGNEPMQAAQKTVSKNTPPTKKLEDASEEEIVSFDEWLAIDKSFDPWQAITLQVAKNRIARGLASETSEDKQQERKALFGAFLRLQSRR